ncbi:MAG TPA: hypothetical protein VJ819_02960 [Nocardioidaceae bacterium]|nr:hypothetical protein [Nocardioidaceae bacterium]
MASEVFPALNGPILDQFVEGWPRLAGSVGVSLEVVENGVFAALNGPVLDQFVER